MRVVAAAVPAVAADAVLVAKHLLKLGAHLVTALARLHVHNLARRSSLKAGSKREKGGGKEWINVRKSTKGGDCLPLVAQHLAPEKGAGKKATGEKG